MLTKAVTDTTFLLTFSSAQSTSTDHSSQSGTFTVLIDPWLHGDSTIFHPKFALARHTVPSCIQHLSEIPPPNLVIVSQDKTDHCHEATLRQLDPHLSHTIILACPAAAKRIRSWRYFFAPEKVQAMPTFSDKRPATVLRFPIPAPFSRYGSTPGEATISFIPAKRDLTGVHNAIGITYRPPVINAPMNPSMMSPTFFNNIAKMSSFVLPPANFQPMGAMPPTPPDSPILGIDAPKFLQSPNLLQPISHDDSQACGLESIATGYQDVQDFQGFPPSHNYNSTFRSLAASRGLTKSTPNLQTPVSRNRSSSNQTQHNVSNHSRASSQNFSRPFSHNRDPSTSTLALTCPSMTSSSSFTTLGPSSPNSPISRPTSPTYGPFRPRTLSVIYSPHGVGYPAIHPYVTSHLISNAALPLTCLLHSFDQVQNPWYFGGTISSGTPGGLEVAQNLMAKCWISAHDEDKFSSGLSVRNVVTKKYTVDDVRRMVEEGRGKSRARANVMSLEAGKAVVLTA